MIIYFITDFGAKVSVTGLYRIAQDISKALAMSSLTNYRTIEKRREWVVNVVFFVFLKQVLES